jgi:5'-3' exonuclease
MILIDYNQMVLSGLMALLTGDSKIDVNESTIRTVVLNIIRSDIKKFKKEYGRIVICCDNREYWRKGVFPHYKYHRKGDREKSSYDWKLIFSLMSMIKDELKANFPYKVIEVELAEADDIIGTLVPRYAPHEKILILSTDGDYPQLQQYGPNVAQFNPISKKYIKSTNPQQELREKIITGDKGDGIPNIFSVSNSFIDGIRQKSATQGLIEKCMDPDNEIWKDATLLERFNQNKTLIDLSLIPNDIKDKIINTFEETQPVSKSKLLSYLMKHRLTNFIEVIGDF